MPKSHPSQDSNRQTQTLVSGTKFKWAPKNSIIKLFSCNLIKSNAKPTVKYQNFSEDKIILEPDTKRRQHQF